ncbi:MAG: hypothetical protein EHM45_08500 [Desulfobacteraceae bacterium]|nr:MAG: hypothetical protein EHM45_08500 [Desulfobacteraceae bacterium]
MKNKKILIILMSLVFLPVEKNSPENKSRTDSCVGSFIVQMTVAGFGNEKEHILAGQLEKRLNLRLRKDKNGECTGTDAGSNSINFFIENVCNVDRGVAVTLEELKSLKISDRCIVAIYKDESFSVVWPKGFTGRFSLF